MAGDSVARTQTTAVYEQLRRDIIKAKYLPGQKLRIAPLCAGYGTGLSPVREALNRLSRDGLVVHTDQRGFCVSGFSEADLEELTRTRGWLNELALRESIARGDQMWEDGVVLAYHRLAKTPRYDKAEQVSEDWERAHRAFHDSLIAGCQSRWLQHYCEQLFDAAERYRNLSRRQASGRSKRTTDEHRAIADAVVARDATNAVRLLHRHFDHTAQLVRAHLALVARSKASGA